MLCLQSLRIDRYSVLGWCDGSLTAVVLAAKATDRVQNLVIWGCRAYVTEGDILFHEEIRDVGRWTAAMRKPYVELYGEEYFLRIWNGLLDSYRRRFGENRGNICRERLAEITAPTLILHGEKDRVILLERSIYLRENIKNSR